MRTELIAKTLACALVGLSATVPMRSSTIDQPAAWYTSSTTLIDISGLTNRSFYGDISGGGLDVTFSAPLQRLTVPISWGTWNTPPATENAKPPILYSNGSADIKLTLSKPESVFGFEVQPDLSDDEWIKATFFDASNKNLGSIERDVSGNAGALLFALSSDTPIKTVDLTDLSSNHLGCPAGSICDFAIAEVRFSPNPIPEPAAAVLIGIGLIGLGGFRRWKRPSPR